MENLRIPHFGILTPDQAIEFIQQMLEYTYLHDSLKQCKQDAHVEFVCLSTGEPTKEEKAIVDFHSTWIKNDCLIITDYMLNRCRPLICTAEKQRSLK